MNTKISYLYRDADNYKRYNECIVAGTLSANQICTILDCCDMGEYFIPGQVGLPERRFDPHDPQADHCWFELGADSFSETIEPPTMEPTGMYWLPIYNILEHARNIVLAHPKYVKAIRGKKTDKKDAKWFADIFKHDLVSGSFIPPSDIRQLRDLVCYR